VKSGDRLFGYVTVSCPECATTRDAWVYIEYGKAGWYAPLSRDAPFVSMNHIFKAIPLVEKNVDSALDEFAPISRRIPINSWNEPHMNLKIALARVGPRDLQGRLRVPVPQREPAEGATTAKLYEIRARDRRHLEPRVGAGR
jgi:hypothetical protein